MKKKILTVFVGLLLSGVVMAGNEALYNNGTGYNKNSSSIYGKFNITDTKEKAFLEQYLDKKIQTMKKYRLQQDKMKGVKRSSKEKRQKDLRTRAAKCGVSLSGNYSVDRRNVRKCETRSKK